MDNSIISRRLFLGVATVNRYRVMAAQGWYGLDPATSYRDLQLFHSNDSKTVQQLHLPQVNHVACEMDHLDLPGCNDGIALRSK